MAQKRSARLAGLSTSEASTRIQQRRRLAASFLDSESSEVGARDTRWVVFTACNLKKFKFQVNYFSQLGRPVSRPSSVTSSQVSQTIRY